MKNNFPALNELLPHGPEALALDAVATWEPGIRATACLTIRPELILYDESVKGIPAWGSIEIMAQTLGVYAGLNAEPSELQTSPGYLVGVRRFRASKTVLDEGLELSITAECKHCESWGLGTFACSILDGEEQLASATLSVWRPHKKASPS